MKRFLKKLIALLSACALIFASGFPALAGGDESYFIDMPPGDYAMTSLRFNVLPPGDEDGVPSTAKLSGPDVDADGSIYLEQGKNYTFYYEETMPYGYHPTYGFEAKTQIGFLTLTGSSNYYIPINGKTTFALPAEGADVSVKISFNDVSLSSWLAVYGAADVYGPTVQLSGQITIEVTTMVDGMFTIPESDRQLTYENAPDYAEELATVLDEYATATRRGDSRYGTLFSEQQELSYRIDLDGNMIGFGAEYPETALNMGFSIIGDQDYTVDFQGQTYNSVVRDESNPDVGVDFNVYSMECYLTINALDWSFVLQEAREPEPSAPSDSTVTLTEAATVTAGAGAVALGGSALANVLGDAVGSTASNMLTTPSLPDADLPVDKKRRLLSDDEEEQADPDDTNTGSEDPGKTDEAADGSYENSTGSEETVTDSDQIPDLPDEDSPEVSMGLSSPGNNLLNIKGGAADLTIQIEGGEDYVWNYLPAIVAPGASKAIIPLVAGRRNLATLALNFTGVATEERHHTIFVNVIAWTTTPSGKLLKASASKEMNLHTPGIEAKRNPNGDITVTAYADTTLKGYAEIRQLSAEEYDLEVMEDETVTIRAKDEKLGTVSLKK